MLYPLSYGRTPEMRSREPQHPEWGGTNKPFRLNRTAFEDSASLREGPLPSNAQFYPRLQSGGQHAAADKTEWGEHRHGTQE